MGRTHPLLNRQIQKYLDKPSQTAKDWESFITVINETYNEFDDDRAIIERALDISSREHCSYYSMLKVREIALV